MPMTEQYTQAQVDPRYHARNWGAMAALFVTSYLSYFSNGGHLPTDAEGWAVLIGNLALWGLTAYNVQSGSATVAPPKS